ncbi:NF038143 family protein [Thermodesulfovibrionales bacterium]|nr:NF038143 family protein [Thermodesulfovibrionales bacterium]
MPRTHSIILDHEEEFASILALQLRAHRPRPLWHFFIPLMILFEFFSSKKEIKLFSEKFLFARKLALEAARDSYNSKNKQGKIAEMEASIKEWLSFLKLYSSKMHQKQMVLVSLLFDHYCLLFSARGKRYEHLVRDAYVNRFAYNIFLRRLSSAESEIDQLVIQARGEKAELKTWISTKQRIIETLRAEGLKRIFK